MTFFLSDKVIKIITALLPLNLNVNFPIKRRV